MIKYTNKVLQTSQRFLCVSKPRRFGKSKDANMLVAYYSKGAHSKDMFDTSEIENFSNYLQFLNDSIIDSTFG